MGPRSKLLHTKTLHSATNVKTVKNAAIVDKTGSVGLLSPSKNSQNSGTHDTFVDKMNILESYEFSQDGAEQEPADGATSHTSTSSFNHGLEELLPADGAASLTSISTVNQCPEEQQPADGATSLTSISAVKQEQKPPTGTVSIPSFPAFQRDEPDKNGTNVLSKKKVKRFSLQVAPAVQATNPAGKKEKKDKSVLTDSKEKNVLKKSGSSAAKPKSKKEKLKNTTGKGSDQADKPKRARSAYIFFSMENRERLKESNKGLSNTEMVKKIAEAWNSLNEAEKLKYKSLAEGDLVRSSKERMEVSGNNIPAKRTSKSKPRKSRKRNLSSTQESLEESPILNDNDASESEHIPSADFLWKTVVSSPEKVPQSQTFDCDDDEGSMPNESEMEYFTEWIKTDQGEFAGDLEFVLGKNLNGEIVSKRKGMDYAHVEYEPIPGDGIQEEGEEEMDEEDKKNLLEGISFYNQRRIQFKRALKCRTSNNGELDLKNLPVGHPLEMLTFLGNMREDMFPPPKSKLPAPDVWMKVPMLGFSYLIQAVMDGERSSKVKLIGKLEDARRRIKELESLVLASSPRVEE